MHLREAQVPNAADELFSRNVFRLPKFLVTMLLGIIALAVDIRLDIAACNAPGFLFGCLAVVGVWIVAAWFAVTSHLEDIRANYVNASGFSGEDIERFRLRSV